MHVRSRIILRLILAASVTVAGCAERGPLEPAPAPESSLRFTYSGERSGSYQIQGEVPLSADGRPRHGTWAAALRVPGSDLSISAARAHASPYADVFLVALHNITAPGTYALDRGCNHQVPTACALGMFAFNYNWNTADEPPDPYYLLDSGTITITSMDATRVRGSFRIEGVRHPRGPGTVTLTEGSFDVPVVQALSVRQAEVPLWSALAAARAVQ